jgi:hypothetical protein
LEGRNVLELIIEEAKYHELGLSDAAEKASLLFGNDVYRFRVRKMLSIIPN